MLAVIERDASKENGYRFGGKIKKFAAKPLLQAVRIFICFCNGIRRKAPPCSFLIALRAQQSHAIWIVCFGFGKVRGEMLIIVKT